MAAALLPLAGPAPERRRGVAGLLALFAVGFVAAMAVPPKQFDRYVLPVFPVLDCVAALGLLALASVLARPLRLCGASGGRDWQWRFAELACWSGVMLALGTNLRQYHPYELAYYNPLVGGGAMAQQAIPVGWGEGYEQVAAFLAAQPDGCTRYVAAWYEPLLRAYGCDKIVSLHWVNRPAQVGYVVLYVNQIQRDQEPESLALLRGATPPVHVVRIEGIDYAYIYQLARPAPNYVDAVFGHALQLYGYEAAPRNGQLQLRLEWRTSAAEAMGTMLFAHVLNNAGQRLAQVDLPLDTTAQPPNTLRPNRYVTSVDTIPTPAGLQAGTYWLAIGLYGKGDGARLPLHAQARTDAPSDGPDALVLGPVVVP